MSDDDLDRTLDDAAAALRAETSGPSPSSGATRARILASQRAARERRAQAGTWLVAAAVLLVALGGSTAWAYWTGRLDGLFSTAPTEVVPSASEITPAHARHVTTPSVVAPTPIEPAPIAAAPSEPAPTEQGELVPLPVTPTLEPTPAGPVVAEEDESASIADPAERSAYRHAHALHFVDRAPADALDAWDAYLASYPHGRFALEARYNRALCLVRLGRASEAEQALAPFAAGTHGGYRQHEATELLDALAHE